MNMKEAEDRIVKLETTIAELTTKLDNLKIRDRGPKSTRVMTRHDAWRVLHGDLKNVKHKEAAKITGLSYGQIYSARGEYTFKDVKADEFKIDDLECEELDLGEDKTGTE